MTFEAGRSDVLICGGGLAGACMALQLRRELPDCRVTVVEPTTRPLPEACHKVGESSVEIGTHYLAEVLGLRAYLDAEHLPKNGLRFFTGPRDRRGVSERTELGPSEKPIVPSYQMDRGKLENDLRARMVEAGVDLREGWVVREVALSETDDDHVVHVAPSRRGQDAGADAVALKARWVVDATGRRRLLQRQLGLVRPNGNTQNAAWFRVAGRVKVGQLVDGEDARWHGRDHDDSRWLSTVHLTGPGYWVWLIPLSTGFTSVGIVADADHHAPPSFGDEAAARAWLAAHEPALAARLEGEAFADFKRLENYSYGSARCFSDARWACVGEAGLFVDPLYSPGSDFIALSNSMTIALIREDGERGAPDPRRVALFDDLYRTWADQLVRTLAGNGHILGEADVFGAKLWWDYYVYWSFMAPLFFRRAFDLPVERLEAFGDVGKRYDRLNERAQALFEAWAELKTHELSPGRRFTPLPMFPSVLADQHLELLKERTAEETLVRVRADLAPTEGLLAELVLLALQGVGPAGAPELARRVGLARWGLPISAERVAAEGLPRRERVQQLDPLARDLERALGRFPKQDASLAELMQRAGLPSGAMRAAQAG
ncbi:MAG: tryptophan 7-halogenase [Myxococcota bacterium]